MTPKKIVFVKPPLYSLVGSHNNKVPIELAYYAAYFEEAGWDTAIYNSEATTATRYWSWRELMERTDLLENAVEGRCDAMLYSIVESVLSMEPDVVVLSNDDTFMPSKCNDMPVVAARLADMFKKMGIRTVGVGTFWQLDMGLCYGLDLIVAGTPNSGIVKAVETGQHGVVNLGAKFEDIMPLADPKKIFPLGMEHEWHYITTTRGCSFPCTFCYNTKVSNRFQERSIDNVVADINRRYHQLDHHRQYFTDQIFTRNAPRLRNLDQELKRQRMEDLRFTAEGRAVLINKSPELGPICASIGVDYVKIGVENVGRQFNKGMKKNQVADGVATATEIMRDAGIKVGAYLMLGGDTTPEEYQQTLEFCQDVDFDGYIISVLSQPMHELGTDSYKYDTHFSLARSHDYNLTPDIVESYLQLQESKSGNFDLQMI